MYRKKLLTTALVASTVAGIGIVPAQSAEAASISSFISNALAIANDDSHGYSMINRWGPDYDCSSFVITCLKQAGFDTGGATYSGNMVSNLTAHGFSYIPSSKIDLSSSASLQAGDILMASGHTEIYIGNGKRVGAHNNYDGKTGDSGGNEISVLNYSRGSWYGILRYTGAGNTASAVTTGTTASASGQTGTYRVDANLNLRSGNSTGTSILTTIPKGTSVSVTQVSNGWGKTTYGGKTGWIYLSYATRTGSTASSTTTATTAAAATTAAQGGVYKTTANLNLRAGNSTGTSRLATIPKGTSVTVTQISNNWGKTTYGGKTGWIYLSYATKTGTAATTASAGASSASSSGTAGTVYKTNGTMYLRSAGNRTGAVLGVIPKGTSVTATQISNNWGKVSYGGKTGWMSLKYSTKTGTVAASNASAAAAKTTGGSSAASATAAGTTSTTSSYIYQTTSNVNLRSGSSTSYSKLAVVPRGTAVTVTEIRNNWGKVTYGGKTGWISLQYAGRKGANVVTTITTVVKNAASSTSKSVTYSYTTTANLNLRKSYSTSSARILTMPKGTSLTVTEIKNNWGKVSYQGNSGWMLLQYAICTGSQTTVKNVIGTSSATASGVKTASVSSTASAAKAASVSSTASTAKAASVSSVASTAKTASVSSVASNEKLTTSPAAVSTPLSVVTQEEAPAEEAVTSADTAAGTEEAVTSADTAAGTEEAVASADAAAETAAEAVAAEEADGAAEETVPAEGETEEAVVEEADADTTEENAEETTEAEADAETGAEAEAEAEADADTEGDAEEEAEEEAAEEESEEAAEAETDEETGAEADTFAAGNYAARQTFHVYDGASGEAEVLASFASGTVLEVTEANDGWGRVKIEGQSCWIRLADFTETDEPASEGLKLAGEAYAEEAVDEEDADGGNLEDGADEDGEAADDSADADGSDDAAAADEADNDGQED